MRTAQIGWLSAAFIGMWTVACHASSSVSFSDSDMVLRAHRATDTNMRSVVSFDLSSDDKNCCMPPVKYDLEKLRDVVDKESSLANDLKSELNELLKEQTIHITSTAKYATFLESLTLVLRQLVAELPGD